MRPRCKRCTSVAIVSPSGPSRRVVHRCTSQASRDRYFLAIAATDPLFEEIGTRELLESFGPTEVNRLDP